MPTVTQTKHRAEIKESMRVILEIQLKNDANGMENKLSLSSVVEELLEDGNILIHMPIHQGYHYPLPRDTTILMMFFEDTQMYALPVLFVERIERGGFMFARIRRLGRIKPYQRRDCYRFPCSVPVMLERLWINERELYPDSQPTEGQIINFSDGGMSLRCPGSGVIYS